MTEFAGRFPDYRKVRASYASLLGDVDWRQRYEAMPPHLSNDEKVLALFRALLKERWQFTHVLELPIRKPHRDRNFYTLVYGTRSAHGVLTFRDAQAKAEREGYATVIESEEDDQTHLFTPDEEAEHLARAVGVGSPRNLTRLSRELERRLACSMPTTFLQLAADVLEEVPAREKDVKAILNKLHGAGKVAFSNPGPGGKVTRQSVCQWLD